MSTTPTFREKLDYLVKVTGRTEAEIVAEALEHGLVDLYRTRVSDAYLAGKMGRDKAIDALGLDAVDALDGARRAVERDITWGLRSG